MVSAFFSCIKVDPHDHAVCEVDVQRIADIQDVLPSVLALNIKKALPAVDAMFRPEGFERYTAGTSSRGRLVLVVEGGWY